MSTPLLDSLSAKQLTQIFECSPYGKLLLDANGTIVFVNASLERTFGYSRSELLGQPVEILLPERTRSRHPQFRSDYTAAPALRAMGVGRDLMALHRDGHEFPVEIGLNPLYGDNSLLIVAAVADISERKRLENQLLLANASLEEFTYVASHDLKSPLRGIADLVGWICDDLGDDAKPEVLKNLERVKLRVQRMETMISELLVYARVGSELTELETIDAASMIAKLVEFVAPPPGFEVSTEIRLASFLAARTPMETVLRNLISNAVKHHDQRSGNIQITVESAPPESGKDYLQITVSDDGPGIPDRSRARLFKLFQTLSNVKNSGTGIGLALSKRLVEAHGGSIALEPNSESRGAKFRFRWPLNPPIAAHSHRKTTDARLLDA